MPLRQTKLIRFTVLMLCLSMTGCINIPFRYYYLGDDENLKYYRDYATAVEHPYIESPGSAPARFTDPPRTVAQPGEEDYMDLTLAEAVQLGLMNNAIIRDIAAIRRSNGQGVVGGTSSILTNPQATPSVFDVGIQQTGFLFGNRGPEAALSEFDVNWLTNMTWGRSETVTNTASTGVNPGQILRDETAAFSTRVEKRFAEGSTFGIQHDWNYSLPNIGPGARLFQSDYQGFLRADFRRPLLAGSGAEFTRIAGPIDANLRGVAGVSNGVVISRINTDIRITDFEGRVANFVRGIEDMYWQLHLFYRLYEVERDAWRRSAERIDRMLSRGIDIRGNQIFELYVVFRENKSRVENALADVYEEEAKFRRALGLPINDGKLIRPIEDPNPGRFIPDWHMSLAEALTNRTELRQQKWNIKSLELQYRAARNLLRPRLDFVAQGQINAFGDHLFGGENDGSGGAATRFRSAYDDLVSGETQSAWSTGIQFLLPFGLRRAHAQVRNYEFRLAKARAVLQAQEMEISHDLGIRVQQMDRWHRAIETNLPRVEDAKQLVETTIELMNDREFSSQAGASTADLRADQSLREAQIAYVQSVSQYTNAITAFHFAKGTTLKSNNIQLSEGLWHPDAYADALWRAWARTYAHDTEMLHTEPIEIYTTRQAVPGIVGPAQRSTATPPPVPEVPDTPEGNPGSYEQPPHPEQPNPMPNRPNNPTRPPEFTTRPGEGRARISAPTIRRTTHQVPATRQPGPGRKLKPIKLVPAPPAEDEPAPSPPRAESPTPNAVRAVSFDKEDADVEFTDDELPIVWDAPSKPSTSGAARPKADAKLKNKFLGK